MTHAAKHLRALSEAVGISGREDAVRQIVIDAIRPHVEDLHIDPMGSVTARKPASDPSESPVRVLIAAHMDEIGFMVTGFDGDGLIRFAAVGGVDDRILPGLRVRIGESALPGVILWTPIHKNREQNVVKLASLRIDIGASGKDEAAGKVKRGDLIAFDSQYREVGERMRRGKAFDDRAGCSLLIDLLQESYPVEILAAFTVQEEIGLRGSQVVAQTLQPDLALILEGTTANDLPDPLANGDERTTPNPTSRIGAGPVLTVMDRSLVVPPRLFAFMRETAEMEGIPFQIKQQLGGGTDGGSIHMAGDGTLTGVISLPCRYIHSPAAYLHLDDYDHTLQLVKALLNGLNAEKIAVFRA